VDTKGKLVVRSIRNLSKPSMLIAGRIKELKADVRDRGHTSTIIRTAKFGLTTVKQAVKNSTGGILLGKIT
jgi:ribosomal protein S8